MEVWDIYDQNRKKTGRVIEREGGMFESNEYHLVIRVCIVNSNNQLLIQKRSNNRKEWSSMWDLSVGGSAYQGEVNYQAAEREVLEELGLAINLEGTQPSFTINSRYSFDDFFVLIRDIDINTLGVPNTEVSTVKWSDQEEIVALINRGEFIPYHLGVIQLIFDIKDKQGAYKDAKGYR
jgi:isopentenyldiphosphate isomerase